MNNRIMPTWLHELTGMESKGLPKRFNCPFYYEVDDLCQYASEILIKYIESRKEWKDEINNGKMFGVLIVQNKNDKEDNKLYFMAAYSGLLDGQNNHDYFVPPIYDLLNPEDHFQKEEAGIVELTKKIENIKKYSTLYNLTDTLNSLIIQRNSEIEHKKAENEKAKQRRDYIRRNSSLSQEKKAPAKKACAKKTAKKAE